MSRSWFSYVGPIGGELDATNYIASQITPTCFQGTPNICAIYGVYRPDPYSDHPITFSANINRYIANLKATGIAQPIGVGIKKYVYSYPSN